MTMRIDIWSDVVCPWCAIGKAHLDIALDQFEHANDVEVVWRSFELDPHAPRVLSESLVELLASKYGRSLDESQKMLDSTAERAASIGLDFDFGKAQSGNTFDAHRLIHLAADHGLQDAMKQRFLRAYFSEGEAIGSTDVLARLATEIGLPAVEVNRVLASDEYSNDVRQDEDRARQLGASGVPFFVIDNRYGISGAQAPEVMLEALRQAWKTRSPLLVVEGVNSGEACGPDGNC